MTLSQIKETWEKEHVSYQTQEVGSGTQRFVREVLESKDVFNLKEGALSTLLENRRNEFICEKKTKEKRHADFVIYINSEIVIPVEVEQYTNIAYGEKQIARYQSDLEKKYGILTDGYTWRFYNNNIFRVFKLDQILGQLDHFLEYWREYVKPEYYYLSFFEEVGQLSIFGRMELQVEDNRQLFFEDITTLIRGFRRKLRVEGYFNGLKGKEAEKRATEITYAYIIQFLLYKTLVDNRFKDFKDDYKARLESIYNAIKSRSYKEILGTIEGMSQIISDNVYRPFIKEQEYIRDKLLKLFHSAKNELSDVSPWLDIVMFIKKWGIVNIRNEIFGFVYENYLKELYKEEKKGQYYTDPLVVNFMLEEVGYKAEKLKNEIKANRVDKLSIVDPACGSGTFLYSAASEIIRSLSSINEETSRQIEGIVSTNVFGLDVEEFPLYLAEMNILMRMLPLILTEKYNNPLEKKIKVFLTKDSIAEFAGSGLEYTDSNVGASKGQLSYFSKVVKLPYSSYVRDEEDLTEMIQSMTSFPRRRFDYVIANPPYVSYNECSKQGMLAFELLKEGKIKLNNIYGVNLHSVPGHPKRYRPNPNLYAFFLALGLNLLKDNGRLCYIIPQTLLTAGDLDVLRYHLAKYVTIEKITTFNRNLFIERGLKQKKVVPTSSLIIVISKNAPEKNNRVKIINYTNGNDTVEETIKNIIAGKKTDTKEIMQSSLKENFINWNFILQDDAFTDFYEEYKNSSGDIGLYYEHKRADREFGIRFYFDSGYSIDERRVLEKPVEGKLNYRFPRLGSKRWRINKYKGYWPNIRSGNSPLVIELRQANQGYNLLDSRYKVIWSYMNPNRFYFCDTPVLWPRNQICAIGSENLEEILYLFSILNSPVSFRVLTAQLKSKHEKDLLISTTSVKQYVRIPIINNDEKEKTKKEIISKAKELIDLEEATLQDYADFSNILVQGFDDVRLEKDKLILVNGSEEIKLQIRGNAEIVAEGIVEELGGQRGFEKKYITIQDLKQMTIIDYIKQNRIKSEIDDLVNSLYFKTRERS